MLKCVSVLECVCRLESALVCPPQMQSRQLQLEDTLQRVDNQASQARQRIIQLNQVRLYKWIR